jgi:hypothetical protein
LGVARVVRVGGLPAVPLGFLTGGEALAEPRGAIAIYDSSAAPGTAEAVYMRGRAEELSGDELERGVELFDRVSQKGIARAWELSDVQPPSLFRLYRATASEHFVLIRGRDPERGSGVDRREQVTL